MASEPDKIGTTRELRRRRRRVMPWVALIIALIALMYAFPPVRFVRVTASPTARPLEAKAATQEFWDARLTSHLADAVDAEALVASIRADPAAARDKHSRRLGVGGSYYYFLRGTGRVVSKERSSISLALGTGNEGDPAVVIETGNIFGNAVRDGIGAFDLNSHPNSQDFNRISEELNKLVMSRVLPALRERAAVGSEVDFTGVAEVADEETDLRPLRVVPVAAEVK